AGDETRPPRTLADEDEADEGRGRRAASEHERFEDAAVDGEVARGGDERRRSENRQRARRVLDREVPVGKLVAMDDRVAVAFVERRVEEQLPRVEAVVQTAAAYEEGGHDEGGEERGRRSAPRLRAHRGAVRSAGRRR